MEENVLKKLQKTELEILLEVDRICKDNNITYQLHAGTLLGAVRHKGFIPWDDDIDILMPIKDYNKFCKVCRSNLNEDYFLQTILTDKFNHFFAKVRKNGTQMVEEGLCNLKSQGIWIDIFPLVKVDKSTSWLSKHNKRLHSLRRFLKKVNSTAPLKQLTIDKKLLRLMPKRLIHAVAGIYSRLLFHNNKRYDACCCLDGGDCFQSRFPSDLFDETCEVEFEGHLFPAPKQYDKYLTMAYGDYMTPPPPEKRNGGCHTVIHIDFGSENELIENAEQ